MLNIQYICKKVNYIIKKSGTRDPFLICKDLNIHIYYKELGTGIKAFFFCQSRIKNIVINSCFEDITRRILCAHELGHAVLHEKLSSTLGFQELKFFDTLIPTEYEANLFAAELMISDNDALDMLYRDNITFFEIAKEIGVPIELLLLKFKILKTKGYNIEIPYEFSGNFLKTKK